MKDADLHDFTLVINESLFKYRCLKETLKRLAFMFSFSWPYISLTGISEPRKFFIQGDVEVFQVL